MKKELKAAKWQQSKLVRISYHLSFI
jgi:hypothetical protein